MNSHDPEILVAIQKYFYLFVSVLFFFPLGCGCCASADNCFGGKANMVQGMSDCHCGIQLPPGLLFVQMLDLSVSCILLMFLSNKK